MSRYKMCQQIRFVGYYTLYGVCRICFAEPDSIFVFKIFYGVFGGRTRLAMPKTTLRTKLVVIEAWFRGY